MRNFIIGFLLALAGGALADTLQVETTPAKQMMMPRPWAFSASAGQLVEIQVKVDGVAQVDKSKTVPTGKQIAGTIRLIAEISDE